MNLKTPFLKIVIGLIIFLGLALGYIVITSHNKPVGPINSPATLKKSTNTLVNLNQSINSDIAKKLIEEKAKTIIQLLKNQDVKSLSDYIHPIKGVSFSPIPVIYQDAVKNFSRAEIGSLLQDNTIHNWGWYYETDEVIKLTAAEYFKNYVYDYDFAASGIVNYNKIHKSKMYVDVTDISENYKDVIIVEYYLPLDLTLPFEYDNPCLRFYFEEFKNNWYLTYIVHSLKVSDMQYSVTIYKELQDFTNRAVNKINWGKENIPSISSDKAKQIISEKSNYVLQVIKDRDFLKLSDCVHPSYGIRVSNYSTVVEYDRVLTKNEILNNSKTTKYIWGEFAGSGFPIKQTLDEYFNAFVYDVDFLAAPEISYNKTPEGYHSCFNCYKAYPNSICVEYYFEYTMKDKNPLSWHSLSLVFQEYQKVWYLVGIIHGEWTI